MTFVPPHSIAFFDFDGTITTSDTMLQLARFHKGKKAYLIGMLSISPWLMALKLKLISATTAKEKLLQHFFAGMKQRDFNDLCDRFTNELLPSFIRPAALQAIRNFQQQQVPVTVVTASAVNWVGIWCKQQGIGCIGTELALSDGRITGKLSSVNCNGAEKVNRIKQVFRLQDYQQIYCYGDSSGDQQMLALATHPHLKPFR